MGNNVEARFIAGLLSFGMYTDFLVFGHKKTPEIVKIRAFCVHFSVQISQIIEIQCLLRRERKRNP